MQRLVLATGLVLALAVQGATASTCTKAVTDAIDDPAGATFTCVNTMVTSLAGAYSAQGAPALNLTELPVTQIFQSPKKLIATPFAQALIKGIFVTAVGGVYNATGHLPACNLADPAVYAKSSSDLIADGFAECTGWAASNAYFASNFGAGVVETALLDMATHLFGVVFVQGVFTAAVPCIPAACGGISEQLCEKVDVSGAIPTSFPANVQASSFSRLSALSIGFGKREALNITGYLSTSNAVTHIVQQVLGGLPASYGGPITGSSYTLNCTKYFSSGFGTGLPTSSPKSFGHSVEAGAVTALASMAAAAINAL